MSFIEVKNKIGTGGNNPPSGYSSWLEFWEEKRGKKANSCEAMACTGGPDVGGHVIRAGEGPKEYILPLCYSCNNKPENEIFRAWEGDLVPVTG